jgi:hypothetical protein
MPPWVRQGQLYIYCKGLLKRMFVKMSLGLTYAYLALENYIC